MSQSVSQDKYHVCGETITKDDGASVRMLCMARSRVSKPTRSSRDVEPEDIALGPIPEPDFWLAAKQAGFSWTGTFSTYWMLSPKSSDAPQTPIKPLVRAKPALEIDQDQSLLF